jgi:GT2 family glycosyltransferase
MTKSDILISVVIPTYHRNVTLANCLDCLAPGKQSLDMTNYEVIVTDDGTQSTSQQMLREKYPWARWKEGPKRGPAANRNSGVQSAWGEFIAFTDDDCLPQYNWLEILRDAIVPETDIYEGKTLCKEGVSSPLWHAPVNEDGGWLWSCNLMIKRSCFNALNGFDENYPHAHMEDVDLRERIKQKKLSPLFVDNAIVNHPPRRLPIGHRAAHIWESEIKYSCKFGRRKFLPGWLLARIIAIRLRSIRKFPISLDSFLALYSLVAEVLYVLVRINKWDKKHTCFHQNQGS